MSPVCVSRFQGDGTRHGTPRPSHPQLTESQTRGVYRVCVEEFPPVPVRLVWGETRDGDPVRQDALPSPIVKSF